MNNPTIIKAWNTLKIATNCGAPYIYLCNDEKVRFGDTPDKYNDTKYLTYEFSNNKAVGTSRTGIIRWVHHQPHPIIQILKGTFDKPHIDENFLADPRETREIYYPDDQDYRFTLIVND